MMNTLEDRIRQRAYELWQQAGETGAPEDHWLQAERELTSSHQDHQAGMVSEATPDEVVVAAAPEGASSTVQASPGTARPGASQRK